MRALVFLVTSMTGTFTAFGQNIHTYERVEKQRVIVLTDITNEPDD